QGSFVDFAQVGLQRRLHGGGTFALASGGRHDGLTDRVVRGETPTPQGMVGTGGCRTSPRGMASVGRTNTNYRPLGQSHCKGMFSGYHVRTVRSAPEVTKKAAWRTVRHAAWVFNAM